MLPGFILETWNGSSIVELLRAVAKNTLPNWRLILDARQSNLSLREWSLRYMNALEMVSALRYGAIVCADDRVLMMLIICLFLLAAKENFCITRSCM